MNRSGLISELGLGLNYEFGQDEHETEAKNRTLTNSTSELTNPLKMVKKTFLAFESISSDVRARF